jgi:hypothetical protein
MLQSKVFRYLLVIAVGVFAYKMYSKNSVINKKAKSTKNEK